VEVRSITSDPAPKLAVRDLGGGQFELSWTPANSPGFVLQQSDSLLPAAWTNALSGATNPLTLPAVVPEKFYRLFKP